MSSPKFRDLSVASKIIIVTEFLLLACAIKLALYGNSLVSFIHVNEISNDYLVIFGEYIKELIFKYKINGDLKQNENFLHAHIFFGRIDFEETPFKTIYRYNEKNKECELFVQIMPWTRKKDFENNWGLVEDRQIKLKEYISKNKEWKNFHRDLEIYKVFDKLKLEFPHEDQFKIGLKTYAKI